MTQTSILRHRPCQPWRWRTECRNQNKHTACERRPWLAQGVSPRCKHSTRRTGTDLTTCSEGTGTALPTPGLLRKERKNRWRFSWSLLVNHPDCPGNHTTQHLPLVPQSRLLSPPAPLTSSCHYFFFEIPLMKNESSHPANTGLRPFLTIRSLSAALSTVCNCNF